MLTECLYALTLYLPVLVGKHVSATNLVTMRESAEFRELTSGVTDGAACEDKRRLSFRFLVKSTVCCNARLLSLCPI